MELVPIVHFILPFPTFSDKNVSSLKSAFLDSESKCMKVLGM